MRKTIFSNRQRRLPPPKTNELHRLLEETAKLAGLQLKDGELLSLNFLSADQIKSMNIKFLNHDYTTDVISFSYQNNSENSKECAPEIAAEIFVCPEKALEYATENCELDTYPAELALYIVHGILHAAGELDGTPAQKRRMRAKEKSIMKELSKKFDFNKIFPTPKKS